MIPDRTAWVRLMDPSGPRPLDGVQADLAKAAARGVVDVWLTDRPTESPSLLDAIGAARARGMRPSIATDGHALTTAKRLDALADAGVHAVAIVVRGADAEHHEARAGEGSWRATRRALGAVARHDRVRGRLMVPLDDADTDVVTLAGELGLDLIAVGTQGATRTLDDHALARLDALDDAARGAGVTFVVEGAQGVPAPTTRDPGPPVPVDRSLMELLDRGVVLPKTQAGITTLDDLAGLDAAVERAGPLDQLTLGLAAEGLVATDLPACLGGRAPAAPARRVGACSPCPRRTRCDGVPTALGGRADVGPRPIWKPLEAGDRVAVLHPDLPDRILVASTLPALVAALRAKGAAADLISAWHLPWDADDVASPLSPTPWQRAYWSVRTTVTRETDPFRDYRPPPRRLGHPFRWDEPAPRRAEVVAAFWAELDLSSYDVVVAPGWEVAQRVHEHRTFRRGTRLVVADFHMLDGAADWRSARGAGPHPSSPWWPGDHVTVHSCFPRYQGLYRALGVPLSHVAWRPYPVWPPHLDGPRAEDGDGLWAGGAAMRDIATLWEAAAHLPRTFPPVRVNMPTDRTPTGPLVPLGRAELPAFFDAIANTRAVVVPLLPDASRAAGISVVALALGAGRPVIATRTRATIDHVRDGIDGLLVPPGDPTALRDAMMSVVHDAALHARLAAGARASAAALSVDRWADWIAHGAPTRAAVTAPGASGGTHYAW